MINLLILSPDMTIIKELLLRKVPSPDINPKNSPSLQPQRHISRRELLILGGSLFLTGMAERPVNEILLPFFTQFSPLAEIPKVVTDTEKAPHPDYIGIGVNSPFCWESEDPMQYENLIRKTRKLRAKNIRIIIADQFKNSPKDNDETFEHYAQRLTIINKDTIFKLRGFLKYLDSSAKGEIGITVDLFDGYSLLHSANNIGSYQAKPLSSPYLSDPKNLLKSQQEFYLDPVIKEQFRARLACLVSNLSDFTVIKGWTVANEMEIKGLPEAQAKEKLTDWYNQAISIIRQFDKYQRPILTGLADPRLINEENIIHGNIINTFHAYVQKNSSFINAVAHFYFSKKSIFPLICQEAGIPARFNGFPVPDDIALTFFLHNIIELFTDANSNALNLFHMSLWKLESHNDNFDLTPETHPNIHNFLEKLDIRYQKLTEDIKNRGEFRNMLKDH